MRKHTRKWMILSVAMCSVLFSLKANVNATEITTQTDTSTVSTKTLSEKAAFNSVKVSETGAVTLSVSEGGRTYDDYEWYYGTEYDDDGYYDSYSRPNKVELYRSDSEAGEYALIVSQAIDNNYAVDYVDSSVVMGSTYYYKVRYVDDSGNLPVYGEYCTPLKVTVVHTPSKIISVRATAEGTFTVKWKQTTNVDGYNIYVKEFDNSYLYGMHQYSRLETDGIDGNSYEVSNDISNIPFVLAGSANANDTSMEYSDAKHGMGYIFAIRSYKVVGGVKVESTTMYAAHGIMDYYFCYNAENPKYKIKWPKSEKKARNACKTVKVKVWDFKNHAKHSGAKMTRTLYITVNKKYAATVKQIYKEIYKDKTKPPIYEAGSYRWRPEESTWSYHTVGTAIDMNCNENPMYHYEYKKNGKVKKTISVGSFYKPKKNAYSIPRNGVIEKTFAKYGFSRLENDLMHFNAEGYCQSSNY